MRKTAKKTARQASQKPEARPAKVAVKPDSKERSKVQPVEAENLNLDEIKELIELIAEKQFTDFELERGKFRLRLGRGYASKPTSDPLQHAASSPEDRAGVASTVPPSIAPAAPATVLAPQEENLHIITSPIVGTFYRSSAPNAAPYVNVGDTITTGKTLCIVEAMKLMNEIQSDVNGTIVKILAENAQPVEYGQPLFEVKV